MSLLDKLQAKGNPRLCQCQAQSGTTPWETQTKPPAPEPGSSILPLSTTPPSPHFTTVPGLSLQRVVRGERRQKHPRYFIYLNKCSIARFLACHLRIPPLGSHFLAFLHICLLCIYPDVCVFVLPPCTYLTLSHAITTTNNTWHQLLFARHGTHDSGTDSRRHVPHM